MCRGLGDPARQGTWPGWRPPFAYIVNAEGRLALGDPLEVRAVQRVYESYLAGLSLPGIVDELTLAGEPAPGEVGTQLATAKRNLVLADVDMLPDFGELVRELRRQQRQLSADIEHTSLPDHHQREMENRPVD